MEKGYLYYCKVERADYDKEYYLLRTVDPEGLKPSIYCLLRKEHAVKPLNVGDMTLATAVGTWLGRYPAVSQKIPEHVIKILKMYYGKELDEIDAFLDRVATTRKSKICKVGVWGKAGKKDFYELNKILTSNKEKFQLILKYIPQPILIPSGIEELPFNPSDLESPPWYEMIPPEGFVLNALYPSDIKFIKDYIYEPKFRRATVVVSNTYIPYFLWKDYLNAKLASKLTKFSYHFINADIGREIVVDVYKVEEFMKKLNKKSLFFTDIALNFLKKIFNKKGEFLWKKKKE
jgi:hypothetical protein